MGGMNEQVVPASAVEMDRADPRYEHLVVTVPPGQSLGAARARLGEHVEYGKWELVRSVVLYGGVRRFWLRRRRMRVRSSLGWFD